MTERLRLAFMGTPDFAVPALRALHEAGHEIVAVYTQPPKPAGRGQLVQKSPVQLYAEQQGLAVYTPRSLRTAGVLDDFIRHGLDAAVVAAYGLILPAAILDAPRLGCLNIHASLLPRWRGAAPIHRALLAGDAETGVAIMQMDAGLDTGAVFREARIAIGPAMTAGMLHDRLAALGAELLLPVLADYAAGSIKAVAQPGEGVTYAAKLQKAEGAIDWGQDAALLERLVRGLQPWPGCFFSYQGETIKLMAAEMAAGSGAPGVLLDAQGAVACGKGALRLLKAQRAGKGPVSGGDLVNGLRLAAGARFGNG